MQLLLPLYWLLHSVAAFRAAYELVVRPTYWAKTEHGMTRRCGASLCSGADGGGAGQAPYRLRSRSDVSISGVLPEMRSASTRPEPAAMVQPSVPWPVLRIEVGQLRACR